uniref:Uncharacterized protein n=1 Tax=Onchocerca volvulus TaxID=6282 RepID=A0A8R1TMU2_ONCVO
MKRVGIRLSNLIVGSIRHLFFCNKNGKFGIKVISSDRGDIIIDEINTYNKNDIRNQNTTNKFLCIFHQYNLNYVLQIASIHQVQHSSDSDYVNS